MCSETSSPRLSFSSDLGQQGQSDDVLAIEDLDLSCDEFEFEFSFTTTSSAFSSSQQSSSADELFSHGIILPTQPNNNNNNNFSSSSSRSNTNIPISLPPLPSFPEIKETSSESESDQTTSQVKPQPQEQSKSSFWGSFKRSTSLNCENKRSGLLSSLPLLSRSNSTGSVPTHNKRNNSSKNSQKQPLVSMARSSSVPQKPPLKKSYGGSYGGGNNAVRVIPVINVPPPYISKGTAKLFGLGSFLHHGNNTTKDRKPKK